MSDSPRFDPVLPSHAIERCAISVSFAQPLPDKAYMRALDAVQRVALAGGLSPGPAPAVSITIDAETGRISPAGEGGPVRYTSSDQGSALLVEPSHVVWQTRKYVRWRPFISSYKQNIVPILEIFLQSLVLKSVSLEYWDRFLWTGSWADFDVGKLLRAGEEIVPGRAKQARREWHAHSGWFERSDDFRRLVNVNVDVIAAPSGRPAVGVHTMMRDEANVPDYGTVKPDELEMPFVLNRLEKMHVSLKKLLGATVSDEMASRIGLDTRGS